MYGASNQTIVLSSLDLGVFKSSNTISLVFIVYSIALLVFGFVVMIITFFIIRRKKVYAPAMTTTMLFMIGINSLILATVLIRLTILGIYGMDFRNISETACTWVEPLPYIRGTGIEHYRTLFLDISIPEWSNSNR